MKKTLLKLSGVAAAVVFAFGAITPVSAQSIAELQALIMQLQAQLAALTGGQTTTPTFNYTRDLTIGSTGSDVVALQSFLESKGQLVMPAGVAKGYFGPITRAAVARYQANHMIIPAVGYFGPITRSKVMAEGMVVVPPTTPVNPTNPGGGLSGGAGDLVDVRKITSDTETTVGEGREERVLGMEMEADDNSDLEITSVRVTANVDGGTGSNRLTRYVDEVIIYMDNKEVGSAQASSFSRSGSNHTATISLNNAVIEKGEKVRLHVAFVANNVIDSADQNKTITVGVDRIRYEDATGVVLTESLSGIDTTVSFEDATVSDDLRLQSSSSNPESASLKVEENSNSDDQHVFSFRLKAGSDSSDTVVTKIPVLVEITNPSGGVDNVRSENVITNMYVRVGNQTYDDYSHSNIIISNGDTETATFIFDIDEGDLEIERGDTEDVSVYIEFGRQSGRYDIGSTIKLSVVAADIEAENDRGNSIDVAGGTTTGNAHTLSLSDVSVDIISKSSAVASNDDGRGFISFVFKVTAEEGDVTFDSMTDILYQVLGPDASIASAVLTRLSGDAVSVGSEWTIQEGNDATFSLDVTLTTVDSADNGTYRVRLDRVAGVTVDELSGSVNLAN